MLIHHIIFNNSKINKNYDQQITVHDLEGSAIVNK